MTTATHERPFLTAREVAARYGVAVSSIYRWLEEGILPNPLRLGGSTRWRLEDLESFEASREARA